MIFYFWETYFKLDYDKLLNRWINSCLKHENGTLGGVNSIFCNDENLLMINKKYLNHETYTDVITFKYVSYTKSYGDIFISIDRIKENALKWGVSFEKELSRIMIHGVLHLLSYNDKNHTEKFLMQNKENFYLDLLFFKNGL